MEKIKRGLDDFKKFALRGNVLDLAVGVIIGGAFGKIVTSLVNDIIMPLISLVLGTLQFSELKIMLKAAVMKDSVEASPPVYLLYGSFIQNIIDFAIIALSIYLFIKLIEEVRRRIDPPKKAEPVIVEQPKQEVLLEQILEELKKQNRK